jgi:hypothetical protein
MFISTRAIGCNEIGKVMRCAVFLTVTVAAMALSGCSTPPVVLQGAAAETKGLSDALKTQRVAINGKYVEEYGYCATVRDKQKFENAVAAWAPNRVNWTERTSNDVSFFFTWNCGFDANPTTTGLSGTLALLTLGAAPVVHVPIMTLNVNISKKGKTIFQGKYEEKKNVTKSLWGSSEADFMKEYFEKTSDLLIERFTKELDKDGALE